MLNLTRKIGEALMIGEDITVVVISINGSQVRLGVSAPKNIDVHREEIFNKVMLEKQMKKSTHS
jgi:carbon storage regulator